MPVTVFSIECPSCSMDIVAHDFWSARAEAAERMETGANECVLVGSTVVGGFDDFLVRYSIVLPASQSGSDELVEFLEQSQITDIPRERVWTILENDGLLWISAGFHLVNRCGFAVTLESHNFEPIEYALG